MTASRSDVKRKTAVEYFFYLVELLRFITRELSPHITGDMYMKTKKISPLSTHSEGGSVAGSVQTDREGEA